MDEVQLVDYDPRWPAMFLAELERLRAALPPGLIVAAEHFGSTAILGMMAKPIIDILIAVASLDDAIRRAVRPMEALGYAFWSDNPKRDRLFFVKGLPPAAPQRTHHFHMTEPGGEMWLRRWGSATTFDRMRRRPLVTPRSNGTWRSATPPTERPIQRPRRTMSMRCLRWLCGKLASTPHATS